MTKTKAQIIADQPFLTRDQAIVDLVQYINDENLTAEYQYLTDAQTLTRIIELMNNDQLEADREFIISIEKLVVEIAVSLAEVNPFVINDQENLAFRFKAGVSDVVESSGYVTDISDLSDNANDLSLASGGTNTCTLETGYVNSTYDAFVLTGDDTYFQLGSSVALQDLFVVSRYKDGLDSSFDGFNAWLAGADGFGQPRVAGSGGTTSLLSSDFSNAVSKNGGAYQTSDLVPMEYAVHRVTADSALTKQWYLMGGPSSPVSWIGPISEYIGYKTRCFAYQQGHTLRQLKQAYGIAEKTTLNVVFTGQSLYRRSLDLLDGADAFETEAALHGFTTVNVINGAEDSSAVVQAADSGSGYFVATGGTKGDNYTDVLEAAVTASPVTADDIDIIFVLIGNTDRVAIQNATITKADHKTGMEQFVALLKSDFPNARIVISSNLGNTGLLLTAQHEAWQAVKEAQYELVQEDVQLVDSFGVGDITRTDPQHLDQAGSDLYMQRNARLAAHIFGNGTPNNPIGPRFYSAEFDPATDSVTVTIQHDSGTDFTVSDAGGFWVYVNGTYQKPTTVERLTSTTFKLSGGLTMATTDTVLLSYLSGTSQDVTTTDTLIDNAEKPQPLQFFFGATVSEVA